MYSPAMTIPVLSPVHVPIVVRPGETAQVPALNPQAPSDAMVALSELDRAVRDCEQHNSGWWQVRLFRIRRHVAELETKEAPAPEPPALAAGE